MQITRRMFLGAAGVAVAASVAGCHGEPAELGVVAPSVPLDTVPHARTWMAWPSDTSIWGRLLPGAQREIARIATILAEFGDATKDRAAQAAIGRAFPGRTVVALNHDTIALGGGGVHCVTQQEPMGRR